MLINILGQLKKEDGEFISKGVKIPLLKNKELEFNIYEELSEYESEINVAIENFLQLGNEMFEFSKEKIFKNYTDFYESFPKDDVEEMFKERRDYESCKDEAQKENMCIGYAEIKDKSTVWEYITTEYIYLSEYNGDIYLILAAECDWEEEHGLQLVFKNGNQLTRVSDQDGLVE